MESKNYKHWISCDDPKRCLTCEKMHGKIYRITETPKPKPPLHPFCRCVVKIMDALKAGTATDNKLDGADFWLKYANRLPDYYISYAEAKKLGYKTISGNLNEIASNKMLTKGVYKNRDGHLPQKLGRVWYEADINYKSGYRGSQRILFSNDGLIFVTYDHYKTFYEII